MNERIKAVETKLRTYLDRHQIDPDSDEYKRTKEIIDIGLEIVALVRTQWCNGLSKSF